MENNEAINHCLLDDLGPEVFNIDQVPCAVHSLLIVLSMCYDQVAVP